MREQMPLDECIVIFTKNQMREVRLAVEVETMVDDGDLIWLTMSMLRMCVVSLDNCGGVDDTSARGAV